MAHCYKCGAINCKLIRSGGNSYICESCKRKEDELDRKVQQFEQNIKKTIFLFVFTKILPIAAPLLIGLMATDSVHGIIENAAIIIGFAVLSAAFWIGLFILGKASTNRFAQMSCRFVRRIFFGAAVGFSGMAYDILSKAQ